jgi:hypothetical protein
MNQAAGLEFLNLGFRNGTPVSASFIPVGCDCQRWPAWRDSFFGHPAPVLDITKMGAAIPGPDGESASWLGGLGNTLIGDQSSSLIE